MSAGRRELAGTRTAGLSLGALVAAWPLRTWALVLGGLALVLRLPLIASAAGTSWAGDTAEYMADAAALRHGSFPTVYRVPGYPVFILLSDLLPGSRTADVVAVQHLLGVGVVCLVLVVGWRFLGRVAGVLAAALAAFTPVMLGLEHTLQPDFLVGAVVLVGVALLIAAIDRRPQRLRLYAAAGLAFAAAAYVKPVGQVLPLAGAVAVLLAGRSLRESWKPAAVLVATAVVAVAPWIVRNVADFHTATMSNQAGQTLFKRLFDIDHRRIPTTTPDGRRVARIVADLHAQGIHREINNWVSRRLQAQGATADQAVAIEGRVARTAIEQDPGGYLLRTVPRVWKSLTDVNSFSRGDLESENSSSINASSGGPVGLAIDAWFWPVRVAAWLWWIASLAALSSLLLLGSRRPTLRRAIRALVLAWLAVALATALTHGGMRRYSAELAPEVWLAGSAGAVLVVGTVAAWLRARTARPLRTRA